MEFLGLNFGLAKSNFSRAFTTFILLYFVELNKTMPVEQNYTMPVE